MNGTRIDYLERKSKEIREKTLEYHRETKRGHVGSNLSAVEILTCLHYDLMKDNDRFLLSKGHGSSVLYAILHDRGLIPDDTYPLLEEHPKINPSFGIHASTGSLGHGLSISLGFALANRDAHSYVLLGDGECDEGQIWEAARDAADYRANNLTAIIDCNGFQGLKPTDYSKLDKKFESFGWTARWANGHNCNDLVSTIDYIRKTKGPGVVLAKTIKGKGFPPIEGTLASHYFHFP